MITSASNPKLRLVHRLLDSRRQREKEGLFVAEGEDLVQAADDAGIEPVELLRAGEDVDPDLLAKVSTMAHPPRVLGIYRREALPRSVEPVSLSLWRVADPGNLGTILRSAEAAGVDAVVLTPGTVDAFNPKVVRASAGAIFHVPVVTATLADVAAAGLRLIGSSSHHGVAHDQADWSGRIAVVAGNEAHGLAADVPVDSWVRIEHHGRAESLNVAMATTVLCFEAARQRAR